MEVGTLGNLQVAWEAGHPLAELLRGHEVLAVTPGGGSLWSTLEHDTRTGLDLVEGTPLYAGDLVFHSLKACRCARSHAAAPPADTHAPAAVVTFWLAKLHHRRLHHRDFGRDAQPVGIACPKCRMAYFTDVAPRPGHRVIMEAGVALYNECPDHSSRIDVEVEAPPPGTWWDHEIR